MDKKGKKKAKVQKKLDLKKRYKENHPEEFMSSSSEEEEKYIKPSSSSREEKILSLSNDETRYFSPEMEKELLRLFMSNTDTPIDVHSDLVSYFDRFELYKDKVDQISSLRKNIHCATVRGIISKIDIHFFEILCCDMVMCYFPKQFTKNERQKCYDLLVKDLPKHYPFCKIENGNLINGNIIHNGKDVTPLMYTFWIRVKYLESYYPMGLDKVIFSNSLLEMLNSM